MEENSIFKEKESKAGPMIGSLIIVIVIAIGGLFYLSQKINERKEELKIEEQRQMEMNAKINSFENDLGASSTESTTTEKSI